MSADSLQPHVTHCVRWCVTDLLESNGIAFIGPKKHALERMGLKIGNDVTLPHLMVNRIESDVT